jgi:hypothetical protein
LAMILMILRMLCMFVVLYCIVAVVVVVGVLLVMLFLSLRYVCKYNTISVGVRSSRGTIEITTKESINQSINCCYRMTAAA